MVRIRLHDGEVIHWNGTVSFMENSRVFLLMTQGNHGSKMPSGIYPAENVIAVEGDSGAIQRIDHQPESIEIRGESLVDESTD